MSNKTMGVKMSDFFIIVKELLYAEMRRIQYDGTWDDLLGEIVCKDARTARRYVEQDFSQLPNGVSKRIRQRLLQVDTKGEIDKYIKQFYSI